LEKFSTMNTLSAHRPFLALRLVVALSAAILSLIRSGGYVAKKPTANLTDSGHLNPSSKRLARARAVLKCFKSVSWDVNHPLAVPAGSIFSCKEF
jgi:hypothetical protein